MLEEIVASSIALTVSKTVTIFSSEMEIPYKVNDVLCILKLHDIMCSLYLIINEHSHECSETRMITLKTV